MMKKFIISLIIFVSNSFLFSQTLLFKPLEANVFEPRVGALYEFDDDRLRLDIGNSIDLLQYDDKFSFDKLNFGTEFYIISRLRSEGRMKFPVETADYYFGVNGSSKLVYDNFDLYFRLRLGHISSHLIDGYTENWQFLKEPFVYSREFIDFVTALKNKYARFYVGFTTIFSTIPKDVNTFIPQFGFDTEYQLMDNLDIICGYDFKISGYDGMYSGVNSLKLGLRLKTYKNLALELDYNYYSGLSLHGMFYKQKDNYHSIGFFVIFY